MPFSAHMKSVAAPVSLEHSGRWKLMDKEAVIGWNPNPLIPSFRVAIDT